MMVPLQASAAEERAMQAAGDAVASSPVKAVYEDADRIARVAVRAYLAALQADATKGAAA